MCQSSAVTLRAKRQIPARCDVHGTQRYRDTVGTEARSPLDHGKYRGGARTISTNNSAQCCQVVSVTKA